MRIEGLKYVGMYNQLDGGLVFENDEYLVEVYSYHEEECSEKHYIDWVYGIDDISSTMTFNIDTDYIEDLFSSVEGYGIRLIPNVGTGFPISFPGYGDNNGYYSEQIDLFVKITNKNTNETKKFCYDYSDCQVVEGKDPCFLD